MKRIRVELLPAKDGDLVTGTFTVEGKKGGSWSRIEYFEVKSGTVGAHRELLLGDDERIIIEGSQSQVLFFDKEQNAAVLMPSDPKERQAKIEADAQIKEDSIAAEQARQDGVEADAVYSGPKTTLGRPQTVAPVAGSSEPAKPTVKESIAAAATQTQPEPKPAAGEGPG